MPSPTPCPIAPSVARLRVALPVCVVACLLVAAGGCKDPAQQQAAAEEPTPPTADERFERIVDSLKRHIENQPLTATSDTVGAYNAEPGTPITDAKIQVEHELAPVGADGEPRRAVICLRSRSKVTVVLPQPTEDEANQADSRRNRELTDLQDELKGVADLDSLVVPSKQSLAAKLSSSPVHEIEPDEDSSCYELEFRDGRWELLTELDGENEPFNKLAIEFALKRQ